MKNAPIRLTQLQLKNIIKEELASVTQDVRPKSGMKNYATGALVKKDQKLIMRLADLVAYEFSTAVQEIDATPIIERIRTAIQDEAATGRLPAEAVAEAMKTMKFRDAVEKAWLSRYALNLEVLDTCADETIDMADGPLLRGEVEPKDDDYDL